MLYTSHEKYIFGLESSSNEKTKADEYIERDYYILVKEGKSKPFYQRREVIVFEKYKEILNEKKDIVKNFTEEDALW
ncbi:hypothetical protein [Bacillus cereus]|uniref:hypothetical protein n=1 Tax=Bacillus cereus TaxID=1396 RepID=UPI003D6534F5